MIRLNTAALALTLILTTAHNVEHIAISGWYTECNFDADSFAESCAGDFVLNEEPAEIDKSGSTCYMNPLQSSSTAVDVFWFGPLLNNTGTYIYNNVLLGEENVTMYKPTNCSANGACECGPFEALRGEDWLETGDCGGGCGITPADELDHLEGEDCAVLFKQTTMYNGETIGTCPILGKVIDTNPPTSGGEKAFSVLVSIVASIAGFVYFL